ncbi:MAG TPA: beta galactosidase jelly roll domain-containing protein, partial [Tepidisphaeraceae bacterium]|nr:beta galactosidase jelly roll domain-containing protein [Tepidisphaeraceae bacterium]
MSRRFGICTALVFCCLVLSACATTPTAPVTFQGYTAAVAPRIAVDLNPDWKFIRQDVPGAEQVNFDDSGWQDISLPHTWNNLDGEDGPDPVTWKANYYRGVGWYRKHINLAGLGLEGKSLFLRFDAASIVAQVYVNGTSAGEAHKGAFGAFCYDVTRLLNTSGDNVIAVRVDNSLNKDVAPLAGDFTMFGGIYRSVHLLALNPVAIDPMDDASSGVYIQETTVTPQSASLQIVTKLRNDTAGAADATVQCDIL